MQAGDIVGLDICESVDEAGNCKAGRLARFFIPHQVTQTDSAKSNDIKIQQITNGEFTWELGEPGYGGSSRKVRYVLDSGWTFEVSRQI